MKGVNILKSSIDTLLDYDIIARKVIITTKNEARAIQEDTDEKIKKMTADFEKKTAEAKAADDAAYKKKTDASVETAEAQSRTRIEKMEAAFKKEQGNYENTIISRITQI